MGLSFVWSLGETLYFYAIFDYTHMSDLSGLTFNGDLGQYFS